MKIEMIITIITSAIAILFSIIALRQTRKNHTQNIRAGKLEEVYRILGYLNMVYGHMIILAVSFTDSRDEKRDQHARQECQNNLDNYKAKISKFIEIKEIANKLETLNLLTTSYLKGDLQMRTLSLSRLCRDITMYGYNRFISYKDMLWKNGFPYPNAIENLIAELQLEISNEIGIAKKRKNHQEELNVYIENTFKKEIGV